MLALGRDFLTRKGREAARLESELLCAHALGLSRLELFMSIERPVEPSEVDSARALLVRCGKGEPTAYITGKKEFYGREFSVAPGVLIPRPETELLVDLARERLADRDAPLVSEFGVGSGCIAITLALEHPGARVRASDISSSALAIARNNAELLGAGLELIEADGIEALTREPAHLFCSNPPYIDPVQPTGLEDSVRAFEPPEALFAPEGHPEHWVRLFIEQREHLVRAGGVLLVEIGFEQAPRVRRLLDHAQVEGRIHADVEGIERVLEVRVPG